MDIRVAEKTSTRPCRICLGLQDDSVFSDFDVDSEGRLYLVAISFDGYGFCKPSWSDGPVKLDIDSSEVLLQLEKNDSGTCVNAASVLSNYFHECGDAIWQDALQEHGLIVK